MQEGPAKVIPGKMCGCVHVHSPVRPQAHTKLCKCVSVSIYSVLSLVGQAHPVLITKVTYRTRGGACHGVGQVATTTGHRLTRHSGGMYACAPRSAGGLLRGTRQYQPLL